MTQHDDLPRWRDAGGPDFLDQAADAYRADGPTDETLAQMLTTVQAAPLLPTPHFDASAAIAKAATGAALSSKVGAALVAVLVAAVSAPWLASRPNHLAPKPARTESLAVAAPRANLAPSEPTDVVEAPAPSAANVDPHPSASKPHVDEEPKRKRSVDHTAPGHAIVDAVVRSPLDELTLLQRARSALAIDPAATLRLTAEHQQSYPEGALREESEVLTIEALVVMRERAKAEARAHAFRAAHPDSLHLRRIEVILAKGP
jgi:hypothetical protein